MSKNSILREFRKQKKLTQVQLAKLISCNEKQIRRWEAKKQHPNVVMLILLVDALELDAEQLLALVLDYRKEV